MNSAECGHEFNLPSDIVAIGGGHGASTAIRGLVLRGVKNPVAIVNTFDGGGGTGDLRIAYDIPAVGDLGKSFGAMSGLSERALRAFNYRFHQGNIVEGFDVKGQTNRNLLIAGAINDAIDEDRDLMSALEVVGEIFQINGRVLPVTNDSRTLRFTFPDGSVIVGEHEAEETPNPSFKGVDISFNEGEAELSEDANDAIRNADMVVLAMGDLYTSVGPNMVVRGMRQALESAKVVIMVANLMNRDRHTVGFTALDYVNEYHRLIGSDVIKRVVYNTAELDPVALAAQAVKGSFPVLPDLDGLRKAGYSTGEVSLAYNARGYDLISKEEVKIDKNDKIGHLRQVILHGSVELADALNDIYWRNGFGG